MLRTLDCPHRGTACQAPPPQALAAWRGFLECALALPDILDAELQGAVGISFRWYDVLVHLEEAGHGVPMGEIADRILASKSGLTRVIDKMTDAGLRWPDNNPDLDASYTTTNDSTAVHEWTRRAGPWGWRVQSAVLATALLAAWQDNLTSASSMPEIGRREPKGGQDGRSEH